MRTTPLNISLISALFLLGTMAAATAQTAGETQEHDAHHPEEAQAAPAPQPGEAPPGAGGMMGGMPDGMSGMMDMMTPEMMQTMQRMRRMQAGYAMRRGTMMDPSMMMCPTTPGGMGMSPGAGMGGMMGGAGILYGMPPDAQTEMTPERVRAWLGRRLAAHANPRLRIGEIATAADGSITAEIVTVDGSLVQKLAFNRYPGLVRQITE